MDLRRLLNGLDRYDIAGLRHFIEIQFGPTNLKLPQDSRDSRFNRRMIRAVARDKFLDDSPQCSRGQSCMWNSHRVSLLHKRNLRVHPASVRMISGELAGWKQGWVQRVTPLENFERATS